MNIQIYILKTIAFLLLFQNTILTKIFAQQSKIDSLVSVITHQQDDTNKVKSLNALTDFYTDRGDNDSAWVISQKANSLSEKINFKRGISVSYNRMAGVLESKGQYAEAIGYVFKALKIDEEIVNLSGMASDYNMIGKINHDNNNPKEAIIYFKKNLFISDKIRDNNAKSVALNNIGSAKEDIGEKDSALYYYGLSLKINEGLGNKQGISMNFQNIASVYDLEKKYDLAFKNYLASLNISKEIQDKDGEVYAYLGLASVYKNIKNISKSKEFYYKALQLARDLSTLDNVSTALQGLSSIDSIQGNYKSAYQYYLQYINVRDSLLNNENTKKIVQAQMKYDFDKKETVQKAEQEKKDIITAQQKRKQQIVIYSVSFVLLLMFILAGVIFKSLTLNKRKNKIITSQKKMVEEKAKEITDNINYAKRLQEAILPTQEYVNRYLPENFILFKPKDTVSGDFYWMEEIDGTTFISASDCTGHGVSGAMVSMVCSNALNRAVKEFGLRDTGKILDKTTELVLQAFEKGNTDVKDGMDISLLAINKNTKQVQWSGANNSLLLTNTYSEGITEVSADKQPIGKSDNRKPFTTHNIEYKENTNFYLFSDGYADQFSSGGKKFMKKNFRKLLEEIKSKSMFVQQGILSGSLESWKNGAEQTDDVLVIGIGI